MISKRVNTTWKVGIFVVLGTILFVALLYFVGNNKDLFVRTMVLRSHFKNVNGLKDGDNVRLSGINVGTINDISLISDYDVVVSFVVKKEVQDFIKKDATTRIETDGLMGDKVLIIVPGHKSNIAIEKEDELLSVEAFNTTDMMKKVQNLVGNIELTSIELSKFSSKMNQSNGLLNRLIDDEVLMNKTLKMMDNLEKSALEISIFATNLNDKNNNLSKLMYDKKLVNSVEHSLQSFEKSAHEIQTFATSLNTKNNAISVLTKNQKAAVSLDSSIVNIQKATKDFSEIGEAIKKSFLFRNYFRKKQLKEQKDTLK